MTEALEVAGGLVQNIGEVRVDEGAVAAAVARLTNSQVADGSRSSHDPNRAVTEGLSVRRRPRVPAIVGAPSEAARTGRDIEF